MPLTERFVDWIVAGITTRRDPFVVGVNGPQGCGKSTLAAQTCARLAERGLHAAHVSIDDFYLTHAEQRSLAARHAGNSCLAVRGYPGTHDVGLGERVIDALCEPDGTARVPRYDKGAFNGEGDRAPEADWPVVELPLKVVIVEGWMLGFVPVDEATIDDEDLRVSNTALATYAGWTRRLDALLHLDATDPTYVLDWRVDAERARRRRDGRGLSDAEARQYVERFLPAYAAWTPGLRARWPISGPCLRVAIGSDRRPVESSR